MVASIKKEILDQTIKRLPGSPSKALAFTVPPMSLPIIQGDEASRQKVLERMAHYLVPGMSIAVIQDDRILLTREYGVMNAASRQAVTRQTRFQAASVSKPLATLAALRLVQRGKLALDGDLDKFLVSWKIPDNDFTRQKPVTLRQIFTHSAAFTVSGFGGYAPEAKLPSLHLVLDGEKPANSAPIRVNFVPGSKTRYSGGGFTVLQQTLIDVYGRPFPAMMDDLVLIPLKMAHSSFQQPPASALAKEAASGHTNGKPITGRWHVYPEMAAAGLWTTPSDLALFVLGIEHARRGNSDAILSADLANQMLTRQIDNWGLGIDLGGRGPSLSFTHNGATCPPNSLQ
ncbi:MAG TPA: serine hydrolase domain-containing protein [Gemmataceae bacterium]|nr:serine hydrolase domain-containing protein [Gemmataceae bacterium]